jgi:formamidopyrimidine-DNA glycosylase
VEGRVLERLDVLDERWCRPLTPEQIADATEGRVVERLARRGKYLIFELSDEVFLFLHLRMTGTLLIDPGARPAHSRVRFGLGDGHELLFVDPRRFGTGELALGAEARDEFLAARLGVEPLDPDQFTTTHLRALARGARAPIKAFLLDQKRIAGVGNIYADEALFRARIHPLRAAGKLKPAQLDALHDAVVASLEAGIAAKGATIDDFRDPYGVQGSFQDQFLVHTRAGEPCPRCGTRIVKLRAAGRGTYVCPRCQAPPRVRRQAAAARPVSSPARSARTSSW